MIMREQPKVIWKKNFIRLIQKDKNLVIENERQPFVVELTEDQFFEMFQAGAEFFGKQAAFEDIIPPCPGCGHNIFDYRLSDDHYYYQKFCRTCGLSGQWAGSEQEADHSWQMFFEKGGIEPCLETP